MPKAGRNDTCPCGSGKKFKKCCEAKTESRTTTMALVVAGAIVLMIILGLALADRDRGPGEGRTWSAEHGHYH